MGPAGETEPGIAGHTPSPTAWHRTGPGLPGSWAGVWGMSELAVPMAREGCASLLALALAHASPACHGTQPGLLRQSSAPHALLSASRPLPFLSWSPMEPFYSALQDEIQAFEEHVQSCQKSFDLHTLYHVLLLLLPGSQTWEVTSLEQLKTLVQGQDWPGQATGTLTASEERWDVPGYVSWLSSYLGHLSSLKETFDAKVVFPLCEHLYVNDAPDAGVERRASVESHSWAGAGAGPREGRPYSMTTIADIAKQLFAVRRKWALLLNGGAIDDRVFSPQSLRALQGLANVSPVKKVLRLVPDVFHKSLATAALARQWVRLHGSRHSIQLPSGPGQEQDKRRRGLAPGTPGSLPESSTGDSGVSGDQLRPRPKRSGCSTWEGGGWLGNSSTVRAKLRESREELMFLLWRVERARVLETQLHELTQRTRSLQLEQQDKRQKLDDFLQRLEPDDGERPGSSRLLSSECQARLRQVEVLGKRVALEEYRESILQSDWLLELELKPALIRRIDAVQRRCRELEQALQARDQPTVEQLLPASGTDSASLSDSGHCSAMSPTPMNKD